jgi:hypothetical protein
VGGHAQLQWDNEDDNDDVGGRPRQNLNAHPMPPKINRTRYRAQLKRCCFIDYWKVRWCAHTNNWFAHRHRTRFAVRFGRLKERTFCMPIWGEKLGDYRCGVGVAIDGQHKAFVSYEATKSIETQLPPPKQRARMWWRRILPKHMPANQYHEQSLEQVHHKSKSKRFIDRWHPPTTGKEMDAVL